MGKIAQGNLLAWLAVAMLALPAGAHGDVAGEIIRKVEDNLDGKTAVIELAMVVKTKRAQRSMKMRSYSIGNQKAFIKVLYPGKSKGITFLKLDNAMWQYVPRIEKTIKIPASMMLQSWMGSDFTNDDVVRESSLSEDYVPKLLADTDAAYRLELLPREAAAVVWGKIIMEISKKYHLPTTVHYYDEEGMLIRELIYTDVRQFGRRFYPTRWRMLPQEPEKAHHETTVEILDAVFDSEINEAYFTKRALKRFSK